MADSPTANRRALPALWGGLVAVALLAGSTGTDSRSEGAAIAEGRMHDRHRHAADGGGPRGEASPPLPAEVGGWTHAGVRRVDPESIFEYMDGGGELYLAYNLRHLEVHEYESPGREPIVAELYHLPTSDDAWGLLSTDWGGEAVALTDGPVPTSAGRTPAARALYGAGLLRFAAGTLYGRILAERETPASREAVLAVGRAAAAGRSASAPPRLIGALPLVAEGGLRLLPDRVVFFRSHLVLNSVYFVSPSDILSLGPRSEGVAATFERSGGGAKPRLVLIRHPDEDSAKAAVASFLRAYLPGTGGTVPAQTVAAEVEDGWMATRRHGRSLALAFVCASREEAERLVADALRGIDNLEASDE